MNIKECSDKISRLDKFMENYFLAVNKEKPTLSTIISKDTGVILFPDVWEEKWEITPDRLFFIGMRGDNARLYRIKDGTKSIEFHKFSYGFTKKFKKCYIVEVSRNHTSHKAIIVKESDNLSYIRCNFIHIFKANNNIVISIKKKSKENEIRYFENEKELVEFIEKNK